MEDGSTVAIAVLLSGLTVAARAADAKSEKFKLIHVAELASELKAEKKPVVCDANTKDVRKKYGVVPGSILLASSSKFDVAKTLPADKSTTLVFYCANTMCKASEQAANRALEAGYVDVAVLPEGIMGWKSAGQKTAATPRS